jgi:hypothetical protein
MRPVRVHCYEGARGQEEPRALEIGGERVAVVRVLRRWREEDALRRRRDFFRVLGDDGRRYLLCYEEATQRWYLTERGRERLS